MKTRQGWDVNPALSRAKALSALPQSAQQPWGHTITLGLSERHSQGDWRCSIAALTRSGDQRFSPTPRMEKPRFGGAQEPVPSEHIKAGLQLEMCVRVCVCKCACVCVCVHPQTWCSSRPPIRPGKAHGFPPPTSLSLSTNSHHGAALETLPPRRGLGPRELRPGRHSPGPLSPRAPLHQGHLPAPRLWTSPGHKALKDWHPASAPLSPVS